LDAHPNITFRVLSVGEVKSVHVAAGRSALLAGRKLAEHRFAFFKHFRIGGKKGRFVLVSKGSARFFTKGHEFLLPFRADGSEFRAPRHAFSACGKCCYTQAKKGPQDKPTAANKL
jgi:hypothetical protein